MLLCRIREVIADNISEGEYYCRSSADMFYILMKDTDRSVIGARLEKMIGEIGSHSISDNRDYRVLIYCGVVIGTDVRDKEPSVQKSVTHVRFALNTARQSVKKSIWFYDTRLHEDEKLGELCNQSYESGFGEQGVQDVSSAEDRS